ncbi:MAG TPA: CHAT domain-containing protein, partial [Thermoanaerobaculia bacterium]|nr:CHAT domain-containing protein [Thermoanaerobaculia bacterium]
WGAEARRHLDEVTRPLPVFETVVERASAKLEQGDRATADALVHIDAGEARVFVANEVLGRWGEAFLAHDDAKANAQLTVARTLATALAGVNDDAMVADAIAAIDRAKGDALQALARGHVAFREGVRLRKARKATEAEPQFLAAERELANGASPMALDARAFAGVAMINQQRFDDAERVFTALETNVPPRYRALRGYVQWQLAAVQMSRGLWGRAIDLVTHAITEFQRLHETNTTAYLHDIVSQCYGAIGDRERAAQHRLAALRVLGNVTNYRLGHAMAGMIYEATQARQWRAAMSLLKIQMHLERRVGVKELLISVLARRAMLHTRLGDPAAAESDLREAAAVIASTEDATLREKLTQDRNAAAALVETDPRTAIAMLTDLLHYHEKTGWRPLMPDFYLRRGRMYLTLGDRERAANDFESGIAELETHRDSLPMGEGRWGMLDAADELFDEAIERTLEVSPARAFAYAERQRARSLSDTLPPNARAFDFAALPPDVAIIEYTALPRKLIVFVVDRGGTRVEEKAIARESLAAVLDRSRQAIEEGKRDRGAYDALLAPVRDVLASHRELVFVPDATTSAVPFAALAPTGALIEEHTVTIAPSARFYVEARQREQHARRETLLIVDNPETEEMVSLAGAGSEADAIEREYAETRRLSGRAATTQAFLEDARDADVIHFAGHGVVSRDSAALMLASGRADAATLSRARLSRTGVVVLAACESARGPVRSAEGVLSVAHAFLQAGAPAVIATLWPIADDDAADFFPRLHRHLARGVAPSEALRLAQLEFMRDPKNRDSNLWAAVQAIGY